MSDKETSPDDAIRVGTQVHFLIGESTFGGGVVKEITTLDLGTIIKVEQDNGGMVYLNSRTMRVAICFSVDHAPARES